MFSSKFKAILDTLSAIFFRVLGKSLNANCLRTLSILSNIPSYFGPRNPFIKLYPTNAPRPPFIRVPIVPIKPPLNTFPTISPIPDAAVLKPDFI